jgi:hypothetical protein
MEPWRACIPYSSDRDLHHFDKKQDPGSDSTSKLNKSRIRIPIQVKPRLRIRIKLKKVDHFDAQNFHRKLSPLLVILIRIMLERCKIWPGSVGVKI